MVKIILRKICPVLCCVCLLITLLVPVSADEGLNIEGTWKFDDVIDAGSFTLTAGFFLNSVDFTGSQIVWDSSTKKLTFVGAGMNDLVAYNNGWVSDDYKAVSFDDDYTISDDTAYGFCSAAICINDAYYTNVYIDGTLFEFTGLSERPDVVITVNESGCTLTDGYRLKWWYYSGSGTFSGLAFSSGGSVAISIGKDFTSVGGAASDSTLNLYSVASSTSGTSYCISAGQYEAKKLVMTGEYTSLPAWPDGLSSVPLSFVSAGTSFSSMSLGTYLPTSQSQLLYGTTPAFRYELGSVSGGFTQDAYALVYIPTDHIVSDVFYSWFTSAFDRIADSPSVSVYSTQINIYDSSGNTLYSTYFDSASSAAPAVTFTVLSNGLQVVNSNGSVWSWTGAKTGFSGFASRKLATTAAYNVGQSSAWGGGVADAVLDLYVVYTSDVSNPLDVDFVSWLATAVGGFLDFELWPGMSLNDLMWVTLTVGVLFWFLKITI